MKNNYILGLIFFLFQHYGTAQSIWPGDVNNNGVVNKVDLLYLGYAFGEIGPIRTTISGEWSANDVPQNWVGNFPNGTNFLYADCNGDGQIDELDATIIIDNIGLSHDDIPFIPDEVIQGQKGVNSPCEFINSPILAPIDQLFNLEISLGDSTLPVDNLSGFTFILNVEPPIIGLHNTKLTFNDSAWIENNKDLSIQAQQKDLDNVRLKVAYTKTDRVPVSGSGSIAKVSFLIEGDVIDLLITDTVTFTLDSIIVLNNELEPIPIVADTLKLVIDRDLKVSTQEHPMLSAVEVYPNPNKGLLLLKSPENILNKVELVNSLGQKIFSQVLDDAPFQSIDFQSLNDGIYWLKIYTAYGIKTKIIQKY